MKTLLRTAYRGMMRMYPASFRSEFGEEMLWIFEEELARGRVRVAPLFTDAARSIVARRLHPPSERFAPRGYYVEIESALPAQRVAQVVMFTLYMGAIPGTLIVLGLLNLLHR
jgi:hypothetical protein